MNDYIILLTVRENPVGQLVSVTQRLHVRHVLHDGQHDGYAGHVPRDQQNHAEVRVKVGTDRVVRSHHAHEQQIEHLGPSVSRTGQPQRGRIKPSQAVQSFEKSAAARRRDRRAGHGHDQFEKHFDENYLKTITAYRQGRDFWWALRVIAPLFQKLG